MSEESELGLKCERLASAQAEQIWVDAQGVAALTGPRLAFVRYPRPAVIYGRRGGENDERRARAFELGADMLQRRTGGGAVYAGPWLLGFHLALPHGHPVSGLGVIASLRWLGDALHAALSAAGVETTLATTANMSAQAARVQAAALDWACFAGLSHGELLDRRGCKLLGTCQWRGRWGLLLSGGLLLERTPWEDFEFIHLGARPLRSALRDLVSGGLDSSCDPGALRDEIEDHLWREFAARVHPGTAVAAL